MITSLFRDMHGYQFPVWKEKTVTQKKGNIFFCIKLVSEQSSSFSHICNVENPPYWTVLMGGRLQEHTKESPCKGSPFLELAVIL